MLEKTGIPTTDQIESVFPPEDRLNKGPIAVIECFQSIPCNPCATSCPKNAIQPFEDINDRPVIENENCNGCGICVTKCPGLAIMVVDMAWSETQALVKIPYEFRPLPEARDTVYALDRAGKVVASAKVIRVTYPTSKTPIVSIAVEKSLVKTVRNIQVIKEDTGIICRCSDIDINEIRSYIEKGLTTIDEIKRFSRLGMGPCQGRTCIPLVMRELSIALGKPMDSFSPGTYRPIVKSIKLGDLADYSKE